jgi:hypothetical protein
LFLFFCYSKQPFHRENTAQWWWNRFFSSEQKNFSKVFFSIRRFFAELFTVQETIPGLQLKKSLCKHTHFSKELSKESTFTFYYSIQLKRAKSFSIQQQGKYIGKCVCSRVECNLFCVYSPPALWVSRPGSIESNVDFQLMKVITLWRNFVSNFLLKLHDISSIGGWVLFLVLPFKLVSGIVVDFFLF